MIRFEPTGLLVQRKLSDEVCNPDPAIDIYVAVAMIRLISIRGVC